MVLCTYTRVYYFCAEKLPTTGELTVLKYTEDGEEKRVRIIKEASHEWKGIVSLINSASNRVSVLEEKHRSNAKDCLRQILIEDFIDNAPKNYSHNWRGLIELLKDVNLTTLAERVERAVLCT